MRSISTLALAAALGLGLAAPAAAQREQKAPAAPQYKFSKPVQPLLAAAQKQVTAQDNAGALATLRQIDALPERNADDNYVTSLMKINVGIALKDNAVMEEGIEGALATGKVSAEDQPKFIRNLGALALQRNDLTKATAQYVRLSQLTPNDPEVFTTLAELQRRAGQNQASVATFQRVIALNSANGAKADEKVYRRALAIAYDSKLPAETVAMSEALVGAYPTPTNWRDALVIFREQNKLDDQGNLDVFRLMRAAGALAGERDYVEYADTLLTRGFPGEAKAVLDEGVAKGALAATKPVVKEMLASANPKVASDRAGLAQSEKEARAAANGRVALATGDAYASYNNFTKAADMYRLALSKGGIDANTANLRLAMALARAGDAAGANAALDQVKGAPREGLARFARLWVAQGAKPATAPAPAPAA